MYIKVIIAQPQEFGIVTKEPVAMAVVLEPQDRMNPHFIEDELKRIRRDRNFPAVDIFRIELGNDASQEIKAKLAHINELKGELTNV